MTERSQFMLRWPGAVAAAVALLATGAAGAYWWMGWTRYAAPSTLSGTAVTTAPAGSSNPTQAETEVSLSEDAIKRAGIEVVPVSVTTGSSTLRVPGSIEPNAYAQVAVTPLAAGRVTRVLVELGQRVSRGQALAEVFSPDLAEAQTNYLSAHAELEAHEKELDRTAKLVAIGAASQQELERLHADHAAKVASVDALKSRLVLLGIPAKAIDGLAPGKAIDAAMIVPAPIDGVITERAANAGLNVDLTTKLFTVVDLSTVWVVGALFERDFSRVQVGNEAAVAISAYPDLALHGPVSYIDSEVDAATRTAKVRVEIPNPGNRLRVGMYADIQVAQASGRQAIMVPREAVQTVGDRHVVYVVKDNQPATFIERDVQVGEAAGDLVEVLSGLQAGERIVSKGSFFLRAEQERRRRS